MIAWTLYTVAVGLCITVAATAADFVLRLRRRPTRFVWIAAAVISLLLSAIAPVRSGPKTDEHPAAIDLSSLALVQTGLRSVERSVPPATTMYLAGLWALAAVLVAGSFTVAYGRLRRARRAWPVVDFHGRRVRVSPDMGPIVVGIARPEIIVPRWVLLRSPNEQLVMLSHEVAHVAARDPILLTTACAFAALMPWNPALWIMLGRLRLAIELDCDARVLREGISPRSYGSLLVDVAERAARVRFAATALADDSSHLHQRILAMQPRRFSHPILRGASAALLCLAGLLAACEAKMPTATEIDHMDAQSAERSARALGMPRSDSASWWIDGVATTEAKAKAIPTDSIARVEVGKVEGHAHIYLFTKGHQNVAFAKKVDTVRLNRVGSTEQMEDLRKIKQAYREGGSPLLVIDGVRSDPSALKTIDRTRIETVDVLKGAYATALYGADASNGVIVVKTKPAGQR